MFSKFVLQKRINSQGLSAKTWGINVQYFRHDLDMKSITTLIYELQHISERKLKFEIKLLFTSS